MIPPSAKSPEWVSLCSVVNSVAISDNASRVVAGTFYDSRYWSLGKENHGVFGTYAFDPAGNRLWADVFDGYKGIYAVAISGDGAVAAAGGLFADQPVCQGLLRAYDAATGQKLLDYTGIRASTPGGDGKLQRVSCVSLSGDGKVLAAVADKIYVFVGNGSSFPAAPTEVITFADAFNSSTIPTAVAVHPSGQWLAACDKGGNVCLADVWGGTLRQPHYRWRAPAVPVDRSDATSLMGSVVLLSVAVSRQAESFVVGGNDYVYYFEREAMLKQPAPVAQYDTWDKPTPTPLPAGTPPPTTPPQNVRWVAISGDGAKVTTVVNRYPGGKKTGSLIALNHWDGKLVLHWEQPLPRNPNSTSMDNEGKFVAASDGYPFAEPGAFYLYEWGGLKKWEYPTSCMNWPIVLSADGSRVAAGGDDGRLYYFEP